ncbi:chemotaxis signal transduction protein [Xenococcus sp. PCC 7305]|uniref:chemotaxis protein CheW n=1 Tax=Xenococcus sp. PCC 7305 TaxID=102125 RepID=UPI0002AC2BAF|nr:chemotaxis protein CheW [Xenococcus sp. PCC 7305]ELS03839.1 chemotaxis signal transduction protein [Xenococcus sp. PCC 7305]
MSTSTPASKVQEILPQLFEASLTPGKPYIQFQLTETITALIPLEQVHESLIVEATAVSLLPSMPESVMGIMSSRNHVFCVIDLAQLLMLPSTLIASRQYQIIVVRVLPNKTASESSVKGDSFLGIAVSHLQEITRLTEEKFQSPTVDFPSSLNPYVLGAVNIGEQQMLVLDPQAIATAATLYASQS